MSEEEKVVKKAAAKKSAPKKAAVKKAAVKKVAAKKAEPKLEQQAVAETAAPIAAPSKAAPKKAASAKADSGVKKLSVTLVRSKHHRLASHKACVAGLGLRRMHQTVQVIDTPENRGMINKIHYMLNVEDA
jgi:large subunit ribosomal protein L30